MADIQYITAETGQIQLLTCRTAYWILLWLRSIKSKALHYNVHHLDISMFKQEYKAQISTASMCFKEISSFLTKNKQKKNIPKHFPYNEIVASP